MRRHHLKNSTHTGLYIIYTIILVIFCLASTSCHQQYGIYTPVEHSTQRYESLADLDIEQEETFNTEEYDHIVENTFKDTWQNPFSTFSIDVDNASYSNVRRYLSNNVMPPKDAVRTEEFINYFNYQYPSPTDGHPFATITEVAECPWNNKNKLVHIGIQGKRLDYETSTPSNLTFLIDVSGSMASPGKLPLVKKSIRLLLDKLDNRDKVSIVVYAGAAGLILPSTSLTQKQKILHALEKLDAGGSTAGSEGMRLAYKVNQEGFIEGGNNRVVLATDGDFNVGISSSGELVRIIREERRKGIYLTICGYGMGNYKDGRMEQISNAGNGNYFYIDSIREAEKVFGREMRANLFTIARDVKVQVEFNPKVVKAYRLLGYENRILASEDFNNDQKDAGELGAGHSVTALYEVIPAGSNQMVPKHSASRYQYSVANNTVDSNELMNIKLRYKPLEQDNSILIRHLVTMKDLSLAQSSDNFRFSAAAAGFAMLLRGSDHSGALTYDNVMDLARQSSDPADTDRQEFISLVRSAALLETN
ncbi:VWA domain-containing protein [Fulvivirga sp. M361]|uniref:vWA domain-containing protein n=1 Tax=Fulvivirga sp. M361 TaxID=2594266 RepID=UPI0021051D98|nr:VWA domain-containing protein [Fulvivirga sp. M361]